MSDDVFGTLEYRVKPITRYVVTRYYESPDETSGSVNERGTYDNPDIAWEVAYALCKQEHERCGLPDDDVRIQYPRHPKNSISPHRVG